MTRTPAAPWPTPAPSPMIRRLRRWLRSHRRLLSAGCIAGAVTSGLLAVSPPAAVTVPVVVAARDLSGGSTLAPRDLRVARFAPGTAPVGAVGDPRSLTGRIVATDVRAREALTDVRLVGARLLGGPDLVMSAVRLADAGAAALLRPGDRVDVLAAVGVDPVTAPGRAAPPALPVASGVRILALPRPGEAGRAEGALVVLATTVRQARALAGADASARLSVVVLE